MSDAPDVIANESPDADHAHAHNGSSVSQIRIGLPRSAWELVVATILALAIATIWIQAQRIHDLSKDIETQVWLRDDALTKFVQGPFADLKGHIIASEILCGRQQEIKK